MSGLSLPLPATVERIAASLVPWSDGVAMSANEALGAGARGSIVADLDEQSEAGSHQARVVKIVGKQARRERTIVILLPGADAPSLPGTTPTDPGRQAPTAPKQGGGSAQPGDGGSTPSAPASPESPAPAPAPGPTPTTPAQPTEPTQPPVESDPDPVAAVKPVVDEVLAPVTTVVEETKKTVVETVAPVAPIVPVLPGLGK